MGTLGVHMATEIFGMAYLAICLILVGFFFYKVWFDIDGLRNFWKNQYSKMPVWHPMRNLVLNHVSSRLWVWEMRFIATLGMIIIVMVLVYIISALIS